MDTDCKYCGETPDLFNKFKRFVKSASKSKHHWGNFLWGFIHTISLTNETKSIEILKNINFVIPCDACKEMYMDNVILLEDLDLTKNLALFEWSVDLHNKVNSKLNKPMISYDQARKIYLT